MTRFLVTAVVGMSLPIVRSAPPAAQDPWTKAPPLPTACYVSTDGSEERFSAAQAAIKAAIDQQNLRNGELTDKVKEIDPMEQASKMQEYMMAHPEESTKLMQANADLGQVFSDTEVQNNEQFFQLENELTGTLAKYKAALDAVLVPVDAKLKSLDERAQKDLVVFGEGYTYAPWAVKEYNVLIAQKNKAYESVCGTWWATAGPFHGWMKKYKEHLIQKQIPVRDEAARVGAGFMVIIAGTPEHSFQSTATLEAIREYAEHASKLFGNRWRQPEEEFKVK